METDKISTASSVIGRRPLLQALVIERRMLFGCTVMVGLSTFIWIAAVCTMKWVHIEGGKGIYLPSGRYFMFSDSGVWEICRNVFEPAKETSPMTSAETSVNATTSTARPYDIGDMTGKYFTKCTNYLAQPIPKDLAYNIEIANYVRTMISFSIISMFVMIMGCGFSIYTFRNPRYMFKRLAAGIHFISTSCTFVVVQVMMTTVKHWQRSVKFVYPEKAYHNFHVSFFLAWFVVLINVIAAISFLWYSKKRKGDKAATDELAMADEPTIIGR